MRKQLAKQNRSLLLFLLLFFVSINSYADWEQVKQLDATYATFVTKSGNILLSDFRIERDGGIYISTNEEIRGQRQTQKTIITISLLK